MQSDEGYLATGFRDVDASAAAKLAHCLAYLDSLPSFREYKSTILAALDLKPGATVADLGCGLGFDVLRLAEQIGSSGRSFGVDYSFTLLGSARDKTTSPVVEWIQSDVHHLPFKNDSLDACKIDRTLQHIDQPASVLQEVFRVLRPGGILVCSEPDWGTFTIDHDDRAIVLKIIEFWARSFRNPWIGRQLWNDLRATGFVETRVHGHLLVAPSFDSSNEVFDLVQTARRLAQTTGDQEPLLWVERARERDRLVPVWSSVTLFINFARKPFL